MAQEVDIKTCKMCGMGIPVKAKKCPYCHHWIRWFSLHNPAVVIPLVFIPLLVLNGVMMETLFKPFRQWEQFSKHADQVKIVDSKMEFGEDQSDPAVVVIGTVKNLSTVDWKDVRFQVDFFDPKGQFFDTGQQELYAWRLPAEKETDFKVSFHRQFPKEQYAKYEVRVISAVDSRHWP